MGRWSRKIGPLFLSWLNVPAGRRWLDVGCGTGALCAGIVERCAPSAVTGVDPSEGFLQVAGRNLPAGVELRRGTATAIPLPDASVDVVVSSLVLNFVPDPHAALREMSRVVRSGGTIAAFIWDYAGTMDLLRIFWDAARAVDPLAATLDEGDRFSLSGPQGLEAAFTRAGLQGVGVKAIDIPMEFSSFDDYWQPFLGGQGPAPAYAMALEEAARIRLRDELRARLPIAPDGSISMMARAWAARGTAAIESSSAGG